MTYTVTGRVMHVHGVTVRSNLSTTLNEFISFASEPTTKANLYFSASQAAIRAVLSEVQAAHKKLLAAERKVS